MKFAKELNDEAVPEWRVKYLDYKLGKKKIKAISKALKNLNKTPITPAPLGVVVEDTSESRIPFTHYDFNQPLSPTGLTTHSLPDIDEVAPDEDVEEPEEQPPAVRHHQSHTMFAQSPPILIPGATSQEGSSETTPERTPLWDGRGIPSSRQRVNYGSIIGTPPQEEESPLHETPGQMARLELPDPALDPARSRASTKTSKPELHIAPPRLPPAAQVPPGPDPYHVGQTNAPPRVRYSIAGSLARNMFKSRQEGKIAKKSQSVSFPRVGSVSASKLRKMFTARDLDEPTVDDMQLEAYRELDFRQAEFFSFLDKELDKIETFYKMKEDEASDRLQVLRSQLHEMRDRRLADILKIRHAKNPSESLQLPLDDGNKVQIDDLLKENANGQRNGSGFIPKPIEDVLGRRSTIGKTSKAMEQLSSPIGLRAQQRINDGKQDYVRRDHGKDVKYLFAKKRLKLALQEFYRGLELLKSYTLLNRTGFRKINKKYDKAVQARPSLQYMSEKVNNAYFVQSDVIDHHLMAVEDLYARYFERGNHKMAVKKLRSKLGPGDQSAVTFRNGVYLSAGFCLALAGLVNAGFLLFDPNPTVRVQTSYLLQLYGGYFLALLLFLIFTVACRAWTTSHINYVFVFEYDTRHVLDWRQLAELPCFFAFMNGLFVYLNFRQNSGDAFYIYWPILLIGITLVIMLVPFHILYPHARKWWVISNLRLFCAPFYPVEFRDFFLGDMYCSQTYAMSQIELFFCLYANEWRNPAQCNSNHSRLLGFFAALPAVWRALQCLRRYYDSHNWFPHLANFLKYSGNIMYYVTLSVYRIDMNHQTWALFVTFALINGVYSSFWDVFMDWSLGNAWAKHPFLRDQLAYKKAWVYYFAIVADVLLRQQWIFYAIFTSDVQHSAIMSFFVGLAEVLRRGLWCLFRVENEHCNNVGKFRASRDIPLPYDLPDTRTPSPVQARKTPPTPGKSPPGEAEPDHRAATGVDLERASTADSSLRQRKTPTTTPMSPRTPRTPALRALQRVGTVIAAAHAQDFEKRRRPESERGGDPDDASLVRGAASSDEDEDEDEDDAYAEGDGGDAEIAELQRQRQVDIDNQELATAERMVSRARRGK